MKTIIVPLDFSIESLNGLNLALLLANKTGANIQMVHVIEKHDNTSQEELDKENHEAERNFKDLQNVYKGDFKYSLDYIIREGKIFSEITALADSYDDVLISLSTHGRSGFEELFIGGNAYKITSHSKHPVFTIRGNKIPTTFDKIVLPLDITMSTREKVPYTVKLAQQFNSKIHLLTVRLTSYKGIEKKLHQYASQVINYIDQHNIPYTLEHLQGDNLTDITLDYAKKVNADLIAIMTEQEKSLTNLLLGSYAHQMINKASVPVLSFPTHHLTKTTEDFRTEGIFYNQDWA